MASKQRKTDARPARTGAKAASKTTRASKSAGKSVAERVSKAAAKRGGPATRATKTGTRTSTKTSTKSATKSGTKPGTKSEAKSGAKRKQKPGTSARSARQTASTSSPWFEIRRSSIQGRGAFALKRIPKGTRIIEYTGERISQEEANRRYDDDSMSRHHTFLFTLDDDLVVDGAVGGSDARYINHTCDPNCEAVIERRRIYIEAVRNVKAGEELGYDYAYERTPDHGPEDEKMYKCRCGTAKCRGTILAPATT